MTFGCFFFTFVYKFVPVMKDRLIEFLNAHNLSSTRLADQIGVQRSSISHIVSGRNKPSFDFIFKFLQHYPGVNPRWLIMGEGSMYDAPAKQGSLNFMEEKPKSTPRESAAENTPASAPIADDSREEERPAYGRNPYIERIVVFYSDKRFEEYRPGEDR